MDTSKDGKDTALVFLQAKERTVDWALHNDAAYCRRLRRKVDVRVIPFLSLCYLMNYLDKVLLNVRYTIRQRDHREHC